ncbi:MAG TPA: Gfo/Idh/MocA family oxidoreductase [Candidatus Thermoplasmatota archaeon]|nr:Gfo/Idh/MocA family oxidoreductase [Candidatus Thermoplasmatota archaeon]
MLRVAIVGYDHAHLPKYVPAIAAHPRAQVAAVIAPGANREMARADSERLGAPYFESIEEALDAVEVDAAYVGTPPNQHLAVMQVLAPRGVHALIDKPIATTLEDADAIIALGKRHGTKVMIPFNPRFQLPVMKMKAMIDAGELGALQHLHATKFGKIPRGIPGMNTEWFFNPVEAGFGGFGDIGIHAIDGLRWLAGSEVRRVHARITRALHPDIAVDDFGTALFEFENGVVASLQAGWANPPGNPAWLSVAFEAFGSAGSALIDRPYHDFEIVDGTRLERPAWWRMDVNLLVNEFLSAIEERRSPAITGEDGRAALEILTACYVSSKTGEPVSLPLSRSTAKQVTAR